MTKFTIQLTLSWSYVNAVLKTFRVEGVCQPKNNEPACDFKNALRAFVVNVTAFDINDVCRRLKAKNFIRKIKRVDVYNDPVIRSGDLLGTWTSVTLPNCGDCCSFLVDENTPKQIAHVFDGITVSGGNPSNTFATTAGAPLLPTIANITSLCCPLPMPELLGVTHNLTNIKVLQDYLTNNSIVLSNQLYLVYDSRFNIWSNNVHIGTLWNILFEWSCQNNNWVFTVQIKNGNNYLKFAATFAPVIVCASNFVGFTIDYNVKTGTLLPSGQVSLSDNASFLSSSPAFQSGKRLRFNIFVPSTASNQVFDFSLEPQLLATVQLG